MLWVPLRQPWRGDEAGNLAPLPDQLPTPPPPPQGAGTQSHRGPPLAHQVLPKGGVWPAGHGALSVAWSPPPPHSLHVPGYRARTRSTGTYPTQTPTLGDADTWFNPLDDGPLLLGLTPSSLAGGAWSPLPHHPEWSSTCPTTVSPASGPPARGVRVAFGPFAPTQ